MITFICGQLCSGKTKVALAYANISEGIFIEVGDILRHIKQTSDRSILQNTKSLVQEIILCLKDAVGDGYANTNWIICGARQKEILEAFPESTYIWIDVPESVRKQRYENRSREGDERAFEEAEQGDIDLGILDVKQYIFNKNK
jgi:cytidylate kinase